MKWKLVKVTVKWCFEVPAHLCIPPDFFLNILAHWKTLENKLNVLAYWPGQWRTCSLPWGRRGRERVPHSASWRSRQRGPWPTSRCGPGIRVDTSGCSWQVRINFSISTGCCSVVERTPREQILKSLWVLFPLGARLFLFLSLCSVSLIRSLKEVQHFCFPYLKNGCSASQRFGQF